MEYAEINSRQIDFEHFGWNYYKRIKKKAMEQEFSLAGLFLSLSIAFFIVLASAACLSILHEGINQARIKSGMFESGPLRDSSAFENSFKNHLPINFDRGQASVIRLERLNLA